MGAYHNERITVFKSQARTATESSQVFENLQCRGIKLLINITDASDTPSVVFTVEGKDFLSGEYYTLLTSAAKTGTGKTLLTIYPDSTAATNVTVNDVLPIDWRVTATHGDTDSITYSVGACTIL